MKVEGEGEGEAGDDGGFVLRSGRMWWERDIVDHCR